MKTRLEKHRVCDQCQSIGITDINCVCTYGAYKTIELEFEMCECCNRAISDYPADTVFNETQLKNHKNG